MQRLIYVSEAQEDLASDDLFTIIEQSSRNNLGADITGFLIYRSGRFLQLVEGAATDLDALLARLILDPRHHSLRVLSREAIAGRGFPRWRMKRVGESGDAKVELAAALRAEGHGHSLPPQVTSFLEESLAA